MTGIKRAKSNTEVRRVKLREPLLLFITISVFAGCNINPATPAESSYLREIDALYAQQGTNPSISNVSRYSFENQGYFHPLRVRLTTPPGFFGNDEKKQAQEGLAKAERQYGPYDISLVPLLVSLIAASREDRTAVNQLTERALKIAESAYRGNVSGSGVLQAGETLAVLGGQHPGGNALDPRTRERILRIAYELQLKSTGFTTGSLDTLTDLCQCLQENGNADEALTLYKKTLACLDRSNSAQAYILPFRQRYLMFLRRAHRDQEAQAVQQSLDSEKKKLTSQAQEEADKRLIEARSKAEVDPVGLLRAEISAAVAHLGNEDRQTAQNLAKEAMGAYSKLSPSDIDYRVSDSLWRYVQQQLRQAKTKKDESVVYEYVDATERAGTTRGHVSLHMYEIVRHFTELHRKADAVSFLEYVLQKRTEGKASLASVSDVASQLVRLYKETGETEKAAKLRDKLASLAETQIGTEDPQQFSALLQASSVCFNSNDYIHGDRLLQKAFSFVEQGKASPRSRDYSMLAQIARNYLIGGKMDESDNLVRKSIEIASKFPSRSSDLLWFYSVISELSSKYEQMQEYDRAESLLKFVQAHTPADSPAMSTVRNLSDLYLQRAAAMKNQGKISESKRLLAESDRLFQQELASYNANSHAIESAHFSRKERMNQLGLSDSLPRASAQGGFIPTQSSSATLPRFSTERKGNPANRHLNEIPVALPFNFAGHTGSLDPYLADLQRRIKRAWFPPKGHESQRVVVDFKVHKGGELSTLKLDSPSGVPICDAAALKAVQNAAPFRPLPPDIQGDVDIQFTFDYNSFGAGGRAVVIHR
jgi:TonB family protein